LIRGGAKQRRVFSWKRKLLQVTALFTIFGSVAILALWLIVAQPTLTKPNQNYSPTVDPQKLKTHVKFISETIFPRDYKHPENLDKIARYIRQEFFHLQFEHEYGCRLAKKPYPSNKTPWLLSQKLLQHENLQELF